MNTIEFLQTTPFVFPFFIGCLSLLVGSFLNVVIYRLPLCLTADPTDLQTQNYSIVYPRSYCPHCEQPILIRDNVPVLSFCLLKGRCRHCEQPISYRYPLVELLTASLSVLIAIKFGFSVETFCGLIFTYALITLAFIDYDTLLLPDNLTLSFLWIGFGLSLFNIFQTSSSAILGAILGYSSLWLIYWLFKLMTQKEGMGFGDFKLLAMQGAWLGWQSLSMIIFIASFLGTLVGGYLIIFKKHEKNKPLPFGPYLAIAGFIALLFQQELSTFSLWILS